MSVLEQYSLMRNQEELRDSGYEYVRSGLVAGVTVAALGTTAISACNKKQRPVMAALGAVAAAGGLVASSSYVLFGLGIVDASKRVTDKDGAMAELGPFRVTISAPKITRAADGNVTVERTADFHSRFSWLYH